MLTRILFGVVATSAAVIGASGTAAAQPVPLPNINALPPVNPVEFAVGEGAPYAFAAPGGVTCVMDRTSGSYGCSGPLPAAPNGANMVSGYAHGSPGFAFSDRPMFGAIENPRPLPPNTRMSFQTVSCGHDGVVTTCLNTLDQSGFVLSPAGSFTF